MKPVPFYDQDGITIYHGDCAQVLPFLEPVDLLLTDPPYGIGESDKKNSIRGTSSAKWSRGRPRDYGAFDWDKSPIDQWLIDACVNMAKTSIIFGGNYYSMPPSSCWLVWDKENSGDFSDGEMAWTNMNKAMRIKRHQWNGFIRVGNEARFHPTQKPVAVMSWCIANAGDEVKTVLDPFMGSGTTLIAARVNGKRALGSERELQYCQIAVDRLAQQTLFQCEQPNAQDDRAGERP